MQAAAQATVGDSLGQRLGLPRNTYDNMLEGDTSYQELVRKLEANVHLIANPAEACPAKWTPGAKTLKPGKDIVGNVAGALAA